MVRGAAESALAGLSARQASLFQPVKIPQSDVSRALGSTIPSASITTMCHARLCFDQQITAITPLATTRSFDGDDEQYPASSIALHMHRMISLPRSHTSVPLLRPRACNEMACLQSTLHAHRML